MTQWFSPPHAPRALARAMQVQCAVKGLARSGIGQKRDTREIRSPRGPASIVMSTAIAILLLTYMSTPSDAARNCLNRDEAARTWPTRNLARDGDGCFTYEKRRASLPTRSAADGEGELVVAPLPAPSAPSPSTEYTPPAINELGWIERWPEARVVEVPTPHEDDGLRFEPRYIALLLALTLATVAVIEVATGGIGGRHETDK